MPRCQGHALAAVTRLRASCRATRTPPREPARAGNIPAPTDGSGWNRSVVALCGAGGCCGDGPGSTPEGGRETAEEPDLVSRVLPRRCPGWAGRWTESWVLALTCRRAACIDLVHLSDYVPGHGSETLASASASDRAPSLGPLAPGSCHLPVGRAMQGYAEQSQQMAAGTRRDRLHKHSLLAAYTPSSDDISPLASDSRCTALQTAPPAQLRGGNSLLFRPGWPWYTGPVCASVGTPAGDGSGLARPPPSLDLAFFWSRVAVWGSAPPVLGIWCRTAVPGGPARGRLQLSSRLEPRAWASPGSTSRGIHAALGRTTACCVPAHRWTLADKPCSDKRSSDVLSLQLTPCPCRYPVASLSLSCAPHFLSTSCDRALDS